MSKNQTQSSYMVQQEDELDKKFAIAPRYNYLKNIIS
jgi:hypothetical protein